MSAKLVYKDFSEMDAIILKNCAGMLMLKACEGAKVLRGLAPHELNQLA